MRPRCPRSRGRGPGRLVADLSDLQREVRQRGGNLCFMAANRAGGETVSASPVKTGLMRSRHGVSQVTFQGDVASCELTVDTPYAGFVAYGTRPHEIRARRGATLRFTVGDRVVYARVVSHPGTRPRPEWWSTETIGRRFSRALDGMAS